MRTRKADKIYIFPRLGNPYDLHIGIPITYPKRKALEIASKKIRNKLFLGNIELKGRIKLKTHKFKKMYDNFYNLLVTPKRFETSKERQYVCWGIPIEYFESEQEYKEHIEIKLKTILNTNVKKSILIIDRKDRHYNKKMKVYRKRFYKKRVVFFD